MQNRYDELKKIWHANSFAQYISFDEAISKASCARNGVNYLDNLPDEQQYKNLVKTAQAFEVLRIAWGSSLTITTALRSRALNSKIGGSVTSSHMFGGALDITCGNKEQNDELIELTLSLAKEGKIVFDQFIMEEPIPTGSFRWFHFGILKDHTTKPRNQIMIAEKVNGRMTYKQLSTELAYKYKIVL